MISTARDGLVRYLRGQLSPALKIPVRRISTTDDGIRCEVTTFERAAAPRFDLVITLPDGHSGMRRLVFGPELQFIKHSGLTRRFLPCYRLDTGGAWHYGDSTMAEDTRNCA